MSRTEYNRNWCKLNPERVAEYHARRRARRAGQLAPTERDPQKRLMENVEFDTSGGGCWLWSSSANSRGYGQIRVGGRTVGAHRLSYEIANGPIPSGKFVCHSCDTPACVNPAHLWLGDHADNMADKCAKGRQTRQRGETCGTAKLTATDILAAQSMAAAGMLQREIAARLGVSRPTISNILTGRSWAHMAPTTPEPA